MIELSDTQAVLLSNTSQREDGSLLSLPASLKVGGGTKAIGVQIKHGLAEEHEIHDRAKMRRNEGDLNYGLFLTATGAAAIGLSLHDADASDGEMDEAPAPATSGKGFAPGAASPSPGVAAPAAAISPDAMANSSKRLLPDTWPLTGTLNGSSLRHRSTCLPSISNVQLPTSMLEAFSSRC